MENPSSIFAMDPVLKITLVELIALSHFSFLHADEFYVSPFSPLMICLHDFGVFIVLHWLLFFFIDIHSLLIWWMQRRWHLIIDDYGQMESFFRKSCVCHPMWGVKEMVAHNNCYVIKSLPHSIYRKKKLG